jgi:hypothetical protein
MITHGTPPAGGGWSEFIKDFGIGWGALPVVTGTDSYSRISSAVHSTTLPPLLATDRKAYYDPGIKLERATTPRRLSRNVASSGSNQRKLEPFTAVLKSMRFKPPNGILRFFDRSDDPRPKLTIAEAVLVAGPSS